MRKKHLRVLNMLGNEHETEFCAEVPFFWSSPKISVKHPLGHRKNHPVPRSGWGHRGVTREGVPSGGSTGRSWNFSRNICSNVWIRGTVPPSCLGFGWWIAGLILQDLAFEQHIEGSRSGLILAQTCQVNCGVFVGNDCAADCLHFLVYCCLRMIDVGNYVRYGLSLTCHMCILCSIVPFCWVCLSYCSFDNIGSYWIFESL